MRYKTCDMTFDEKRAIMLQAKDVCTRWWVDVLDCRVNFARQRVGMSFDAAMAQFDNFCHFNITHRDNYPENHIEISFRTFATPIDYFLWIEVPVEKASLVAHLEN